MKNLTVLSASALLSLTACETMNKPLSSGDFDPLLTPGGSSQVSPSQSAFRAGDLVRAVMDNTAFFKNLPKGEADADKVLLRGTGMKVIRVSSSYLQVELDVTGEIGYVPAVMVENASAQPTGPQPLPGEYQIYPPVPGGNALPPLDPAGLPPDGVIPTVIDPSLPSAPGTVPTPPVVPVPTDTPPTPPAIPDKSTVTDKLPEAPVPPIQPNEDPAEGAIPENPAGTR
ncbi:MAG: hypothetical protein K9N23_17010 [Akkermansiaceae bacterium]|nr:hypothetical protein [Akkermansiaceae bacterium]MCF7733393.1 hypothetical protein [Akkermansiaceae bacterium]